MGCIFHQKNSYIFTIFLIIILNLKYSPFQNNVFININLYLKIQFKVLFQESKVNQFNLNHYFYLN